MEKCKTCGQEVKTKFPDGIEYHFVVIDCSCGRSEICVEDNKGEDCNAYQELENAKAGGELCSNCGDRIRYMVIQNK